VTYNGNGTQTVNGILIDPKNPFTFALGLVAGLQYDNRTFGKCFMVVLDATKYPQYF